MGTEQNTIGYFWFKAGDDVGTLQNRTVVPLQVCLLGRYRQTERCKFLCDPFPTSLVGLAVHRTRTEVALLLTI